MAKTQITTGRVRFSYVNAFHPRADQNGVEKYSVMLLIPKSDTATLAKMKAAAQAAKDTWVEKGKKLQSASKQLWCGICLKEFNSAPNMASAQRTRMMISFMELYPAQRLLRE